MTTVAGYRINHARYGRTYRRHRRWLREFDALDLAEKLRYQDRALQEFIASSRRDSAYFRELFGTHSVSGRIGIDSLASLPVLEKETLRSRIDEIMTVPGYAAIEGHTGGTTGKSLVVRYTKDDSQIRMAMLDHFKARVGFEHRRMRRASFTGKHVIPPRQAGPPYWRYNHACRQMLYSTFHVSERTAQLYVDSLNRFKPGALDGFPSSMAVVAAHILRNEIRLDFAPIAIFPTSETVTENLRQLLEAAFGCSVYDQYASSEGAPFITECKRHSLHVEMSTGVFESDKEGDVLVTSFTTHGTPLIRYRIGDSIFLSDETQCECGIASLLVSSIQGRSEDYLLRADGALINSVNAANLFKNIPNALVSAQLVQERVGEIRMLLVVDPKRYTGDHENLLRREFAHKLDADTTLLIEHVDTIPREASGKRRFIKNTLI
jgi:phenylacetate-CoA ligase